MDTEASAQGPILEIDELVAGYGSNAVLNRLNLIVRRGTVTTITGPNGAGKSTMLKAVFGLLPAWHGTVRFDGNEITKQPPHRLVASGLCYIPQGRCVVPGLTVRQNIELGAATARSAGKLAARVTETLERYPALLAKADRHASTLTAGEQKLMEIARALVAGPKLLMADEPSTGLSPAETQEVFAALLALRAQGITVLIVEQNAKSLLGISDEAIVIELGRTRHSDRAAAMLADPRIARLFLGGAMGAMAAPANGLAWLEK